MNDNTGFSFLLKKTVFGFEQYLIFFALRKRTLTMMISDASKFLTMNTFATRSLTGV